MVYLARKPNGHLLSNSNNNAQNQAWLKAIEVAQKYVVIISPNIATKSFAQKLLDAIRRGVKVVLIAAYGMHDIGEALYPDSLGSNTRSFAYMRKKLNPLERNRLQACFFITSRTTPPRPLKTGRRTLPSGAGFDTARRRSCSPSSISRVRLVRCWAASALASASS